ncbi:Rieske 2Fe-2S domain-containing protein [Mangrovicoccus ximenensis]|uniref:Rieske 2Fe-2S domain-containing protein n=1 Tax=Mangrovicoccus ximenensis TaxID=1911570 RepID=UPI0038B36755
MPDWRDAWHAVSFLEDLDPQTVTRVTLHGEGFALFFGADGAPACVLDRCPHRACSLRRDRPPGRCVGARAGPSRGRGTARGADEHGGTVPAVLLGQQRRHAPVFGP